MGHISRIIRLETPDQSRYVIYANEPAHNNYEPGLTSERTDWKWFSLRVMTFVPEKPLTVPAGEYEYLVLSLPGGCTVQASGERLEVTGRKPVFTDIINYVYVPHHAGVTLTNADDTCIALPGSKATTNKPLRYCPRSEVDTGLRGAGSSSCQVNSYTLGNDVGTSHLLTCEVLTLGGNWSSYPPYERDKYTEAERVLEEIYYYQVRAREGDTENFMPQRVYLSPGHNVDICTEVRGGDIVVVLYDYHGPSMTAPGYGLYYLSVMVGPAEGSAWFMADNPRHAWVHQTWEGRGVDPHLPVTPMDD